MYSSKKLLIAAAVLLIVLAPTYADSWQNHYETLRDAVYNSEMDESLILKMHEKTFVAIKAADDGTGAVYYHRALTAYMTGRYYLNNMENEEKAVLYFEKALEENERWEEEVGESSEYLRLKSEVTSQLCLVKPVGFILKYGPEVSKLAKEALELDPNNGKALIQIASAKVYPPWIYGGNPRKGIALLEEALEKPGLEKDDLFNIYSGMGLSHLRLREYDDSILWLEKALELYPENVYCTTLYGDAQNRDADKNEKRLNEMKQRRERD